MGLKIYHARDSTTKDIVKKNETKRKQKLGGSKTEGEFVSLVLSIIEANEIT